MPQPQSAITTSICPDWEILTPGIQKPSRNRYIPHLFIPKVPVGIPEKSSAALYRNFLFFPKKDTTREKSSQIPIVALSDTISCSESGAKRPSQPLGLRQKTYSKNNPLRIHQTKSPRQTHRSRLRSLKAAVFHQTSALRLLPKQKGAITNE